MNILLPVDGPLDVSATLSRYRLWGEDPANRFAGDVFRRVLRHDGRLIPYEVRWSGGVDDTRLDLRLRPVGRRHLSASAVDAALMVAGAEVRHVFGLAFDLPGFYRMAKSDPVLADVVPALYGLRPTLTANPLEMLVGSITAQQVNLTFAFALRARIVRRYGTPVILDGETLYAFPEAATLAAARLPTLRRMQFSAGKARYIQGVARAIARGTLDPTTLATATNADVIERLTALRGLGRWTADWFMARCLGRGDVCPAGDLAVRKAFDHYYGRRRALSEEAIRRRARAWGPYQNLAIHYLLAGMRRARPATGGGT
ncbi:MAG: DNA-3-methyladenine glycosylase 2 family protein [Candidatus Rokubacteria bacterium]|nr:DNA-3-methyladenine glycosylase 2 family protein [Candidatus Rokubacteria bacterium]